MATNLNFNADNKSNLASYTTAGQVVFTEDNLYLVKTDGSKIKYSSIEVVSSLPISNISSDKIYILESNFSLNYYNGSWHVLGGSDQIAKGTTSPTDTTKLWLDITNSSSPMLKYYNGTTWINISSSTGGHIIKDETTTYTSRKNLKFKGGITITDDSTNDTTIIDIASSSGGFLNVKNLGMTIADGGDNATISFNNPASDNIAKVYLYVSYLEDLSNQAYNYVSTHATLLKDSFPITNGTANTFNLPITDTNRNKSCYLKIFCGYGDTDYSSGASINQVLSDITPTSPVTNISIVQLTKSSVKLNWTNPTQTDLKSVNVLQKYDTAINDIYDGTIVYTGSSNACTITGLDVGKHIYFRIYTLDKSDNIQSNISQVIDIQLDNTPPLEATLFTVLSGFSLCKLKFSDSASTDWKMTKVIRKAGSEPTSIDDGTLILTNMTKDAYKNNLFIDSGLSNGTTYYYKVYSIDNFDNISNGITQNQSPIATALPEVTNYKIENIENGTKQKISWTNPFALTGLTYVEHQLFYSKNQTITLDTMTRDQCLAEPLVSSLILGAGTGQGVNDSFTTSTTLTNGDISRYKIFVHFDSSGTAMYNSGTYDIKEVKDETPLTNVTGLVTTAGDSQNTISWINPNTALDSDFGKVQIFRKIGTYPDGNNDLEKVYEGTNKNAGVLNTFIDTGLLNNTIYYYLIKLLDTSGNINVNTKFTLTPVALPILSVSYQPSTDTWTLGGINVGKTSEDLWSLYPYSNIKRILFDNTTVSYLKADDSTKLENGTNADLTINMYSRIPKFYYKYTYSNGTHTWSIAETQLSGFTLFPAFVRSSSNKDYIDIGCFKGSVDGTNKLESKNGKTPNIDKAFSDYRTYAKNIGTNYNQFDALSQSVLDILFIIQYSTGNVQSVFTGIDDTVKTNGQTLSLGNRNGVANGTLSLYGVEGLFGNGQYNIIDGLKATSTGYYLADNSFESMTSESVLGTYTKVGSIVPTTTSGFIKDIEQVASLFLGKDNTGSSSSGFGDMQYSVSESGLNVLLIGGDNSDEKGLLNNSFVNVSNLSKTINMTQGSVIDSTYTEWTASLDKTNLNTAFKSIGSFTLINGTNPQLQINQVISARLNGRVVHYN